MVLFAKGLLFGFLLAATVGPMWVLCFRRTLTHGALAGFVSGIGIAVADGLYSAVAAFGLPKDLRRNDGTSVPSVDRPAT